MRQIYAKLNEIQELQTYQIDRDRDRDIVVLFLNARNYILEAQTNNDLPARKEILKKANDELAKAINSIYADLVTTSKHLAKSTRFPIFQNPIQIRNYIGYLISDLQLVTKYAGV